VQLEAVAALVRLHVVVLERDRLDHGGECAFEQGGRQQIAVELRFGLGEAPRPVVDVRAPRRRSPAVRP
jgi:hypothetical protein